MLSELKESNKEKNPIDIKENHDEEVKSKKEIIFNIQTLVAEGRYQEADKAIKYSLSKNYNDPQMLSLSALVAVAMQDWVQAIARLHVVIKIQGEDTPPLPHLLLIRSYRCSGQLVEAMKAAELAVKTHANKDRKSVV